MKTNEFQKDVDNFYLEGFSKMISRERTSQGLKKQYADFPGAIELEKLSSYIANEDFAGFITDFKTMKKDGRLAGIVKGNKKRSGLTREEKFVESFSEFAVKQDINTDVLSNKNIAAAYTQYINKAVALDTYSAEAFMSNRIFKRMYNEAEENPDEIVDAGKDEKEKNKKNVDDDKEDKKKDKKKDKKDGKEKDAMDNADDIISKMNLNEIENDVRKELIEAIIDSAQNASKDDEDFSEFMESIQKVIDGFRFDGEEETKEKGKKKDELIELEEPEEPIDEPLDEPVE